jgi:hypothetical protein
LIVMLKLADAMVPEASVTSPVKTDVPAAVGVPAIAPVAAESVSPAGNEPDITLKE